jgi:hypothetical protein
VQLARASFTSRPFVKDYSPTQPSPRKLLIVSLK